MSNKCFEGWEESSNPKGRCCCNCQWQRPITAHPWNKNELTKGSVSNIIGYGCTVPELPNITFFEFKHSMCELHTPVQKEENV